MIDYEVHAGNWFSTLTPLSHTGYWGCREVARTIAQKLALDWAALNVPHYAEQKYDKALKAYRKKLKR